MKKLLICLVLIIATVSMASALDLNYGLRTGVVLGNMSVDPDPTEDSDLEAKMKMGFYCGLWARHMMNEKMGITAGLNYVEKGDRYSEDMTGATMHIIMYANVLELPVLFTYLPSEKFALFAGPVLEYVMSSGYNMLYDVEDPDVAEYMGYNFGEWTNRIGFSIAAGMTYQINETFFGEVRYTYGFSNVISDEQELMPEEIEAVPRTLTIGIGINL